MRLSDDLAAKRRLYAMPLVTAPAVMVIDIPPHQAAQDLALDRYYIVMIENDEELAALEAFLTADRDALCPPDLLDRKRSCREAGAIGFFAFAPPEPGWPWILLCHWPRHFAQLFGGDPHALARGAYSMEAFMDHEALQSALQKHIAVFGGLATVKIIPPLSGTAGQA
ncbi:MAG: hypothetical protein EPO45_17345 [Sphingobium sp.]|nr:MAG: hypothetical protein EPO45_17345 [Sphingobium sp.]